MSGLNIALQMYTLREPASKDMAGMLTAVAAMGYAGVELAGLNGMTAEELHSSLKANNLCLVSAHVGMDELTDNLDFWLDALPRLEACRVTIPGIAPDQLDEDTIAETAAIVNRIQAQLKTVGVELSYHNHDFEMAGGRLERLLSHCPALKLELDTYWLEYAGVSAVSLMRQLADRLSLIHVKDMHADPAKRDINPHLFEGILDIAAILDQAAAQSMEWAIVEMDTPDGDPVEAVRISRENLRKRGY